MRDARDKQRLRVLNAALEEARARGLVIEHHHKRRALSLTRVALGEGTGARILRELLSTCDAIAMTVYATPAEEGEAQYRTLGFAWPARQVRCPRHGLPQMVRRPRRWRPSP